MTKSGPVEALPILLQQGRAQRREAKAVKWQDRKARREGRKNFASLGGPSAEKRQKMKVSLSSLQEEMTIYTLIFMSILG